MSNGCGSNITPLIYSKPFSYFVVKTKGKNKNKNIRAPKTGLEI